MGLFDKKYCDICGEKISLLGNRKLDDGNMCSSCAKLISPLFTDRRKTSVADMKEHLADREANRQKVAAFQVSETFGEGRKLYLDRTTGCFILSYSSPGSWEKENPDVIPCREVSACYLDIQEKREELFTKDADGNRKSYSPARYKYLYDFNMHIGLSSRWFSEIDWKLNSFDVEGLNSQKYHNYQVMGQQITDALTSCRSAQAPGVGGMSPLEAEDARVQAERAKLPSTPEECEAAMAQARAKALEALQTTGVSRDAKKVCPNCKQFCDGKFCQECGAVAVYPVTVQCASCGFEIDMESLVPKFCPACGHKIDTGDLVYHDIPTGA